MSITRIKSQFEAKRARTEEMPNPAYSIHFWTSNDHFSIAEDDFPGFEEGKGFKSEAKGIVNLFVGESDIFSAIHKIEGDIIIFDTEKHYVMKVFLNAIMLIPVLGWILGGIKSAATGTYFFHAATRREQIFAEEIDMLKCKANLKT